VAMSAAVLISFLGTGPSRARLAAPDKEFSDVTPG